MNDWKDKFQNYKIDSEKISKTFQSKKIDPSIVERDKNHRLIIEKFRNNSWFKELNSFIEEVFHNVEGYESLYKSFYRHSIETKQKVPFRELPVVLKRKMDFQTYLNLPGDPGVAGNQTVGATIEFSFYITDDIDKAYVSRNHPGGAQFDPTVTMDKYAHTSYEPIRVWKQFVLKNYENYDLGEDFILLLELICYFISNASIHNLTQIVNKKQITSLFPNIYDERFREDGYWEDFKIHLDNTYTDMDEIVRSKWKPPLSVKIDDFFNKFTK